MPCILTIFWITYYFPVDASQHGNATLISLHGTIAYVDFRNVNCAVVQDHWIRHSTTYIQSRLQFPDFYNSFRYLNRSSATAVSLSFWSAAAATAVAIVPGSSSAPASTRTARCRQGSEAETHSSGGLRTQRQPATDYWRASGQTSAVSRLAALPCVLAVLQARKSEPASWRFTTGSSASWNCELWFDCQAADDCRPPVNVSALLRNIDVGRTGLLARSV